MPRATLYTDVQWRDLLRFAPPTPNESNPGFSAYGVTGAPLVQLGLVEEPKLRVHSSSRRGLRLRVSSSEQLHFVRELEEQLVQTVARSAPQWFGKDLSIAHVRDMFEPSTIADPRGRTTLMLRTEDDTRVFVHERGTARDGTSAAALRPGTACCVIFGITGLFFEEKRWGANMSVSAVLAFEDEDDSSDDESEASAETEVRRRFELGGLGGRGGGNRRAHRGELRSNEHVFRELRDEALEQEASASSWCSRRPFGQPLDAPRSTARWARDDGGSRTSGARSSRASGSRSERSVRNNADLVSDAAADQSDFELDLSDDDEEVDEGGV